MQCSQFVIFLQVIEQLINPIHLRSEVNYDIYVLLFQLSDDLRDRLIQQRPPFSISLCFDWLDEEEPDALQNFEQGLCQFATDGISEIVWLKVSRTQCNTNTSNIALHAFRVTSGCKVVDSP